MRPNELRSLVLEVFSDVWGNRVGLIFPSAFLLSLEYAIFMSLTGGRTWVTSMVAAGGLQISDTLTIIAMLVVPVVSAIFGAIGMIAFYAYKRLDNSNQTGRQNEQTLYGANGDTGLVEEISSMSLKLDRFEDRFDNLDDRITRLERSIDEQNQPREFEHDSYPERWNDERRESDSGNRNGLNSNRND